MNKIVLLKDLDNEYSECFKEAGLQAEFLPVLEFEYINNDILLERLKNYNEYTGIVVTSKRGIEALQQHVQQLELWIEKPIFVVGNKTSIFAQQVGFKHIIGQEAGQGSSLAQVILDHLHNAKLLFPVALDHRPELQDRLSGTGVDLDMLPVYQSKQRVEIDTRVLTDAQWIGFFSPKGVQAAKSMFADRCRNMRKAAIGNTTAEAIAAAGWKVHAKAAKPKASEFVAAVVEYNTNNNCYQ